MNKENVVTGNEPWIRPDKDFKRAPESYRKYPSDFRAQYDMLLPDGIICNDCTHGSYCQKVFGQNPENDYCQFYPTRYRATK